jgi:hypothetical protein
MPLMGKTLTTCSLSICALLQTAAFGADQNWRLHQTFEGYSWAWKPADVEVNSKALHFRWTNEKANLILKAPKWNVTAFNDWHYDSWPYERFLGSVKGKTAAKYLQGLKLEKVGTSTIAGVEATEYADTSTADKPFDMHVWVANDIALPPQVARFVGTIYGAPNVGLMPVRIVITKPDGTVWRTMDTTSIAKKPFRNIVVKEPTYLAPGKSWFPGDFFEREERPPDPQIKADIKLQPTK